MSSAVRKFHSKTYILKQNSAFNNALFFYLQYPSHKKTPESFTLSGYVLFAAIETQTLLKKIISQSQRRFCHLYGLQLHA